ncbi:MAG: ABC transporter substrate-binding protein [Bacillota bacterium]|nr:ABC transporter substrate-binding protein [Bacillota bacterium]
MFKKALIIVLAVSMAFMISSCKSSSNNDFPVTIGNITINSAPQSVVVLSDAVADVVVYMGYEAKLVGRSSDCTQSKLSVVPTVGTEQSPNITKITNLKPSVVLASDQLSKVNMQKLSDAGLTVITFSNAPDRDRVKTLYSTVGAVFEGNTTGKAKGTSSVANLFQTLDDYTRSVPKSNVVKTACYLYMDGNTLKAVTGDTFGDKLITYTGAINIAANNTNGQIDAKALKINNPKYIFCPEGQSSTIKSNAAVSGLSAVKNNSIYEIPKADMFRFGESATSAVMIMMMDMYPQLNNTGASVPGTDDSTSSSSVTTGGNLQSQYSINVTDDMVLKVGDQNNNVMAMQKRLDDLGYMGSAPTGYFGDLTTQAIKDFQLANNYNATGTADATFLRALFSSDVIKSATPARAR